MADHPDDPDAAREQLSLITQETRFALIQDILGHPSGLPSLKELVYVNPSKSQSTIRQHLQRLIDAEIVAAVRLPEDQRQNDRPYTFYGLTDPGRQLLKDHDLYGATETLQVAYESVEKTDEIRRYEAAPRPEP